MGSWIWVKYVDAHPALRRLYNDHYAARAGVPTAAGKLPVTWADGTAPENVTTNRIMRMLTPAEERVVFDGPANPGRAASLTQVSELLKKGSIYAGAPPAARNPDGSRLFPGMVFTQGTMDCDKALRWLTSSDSSFNPEDIAGRLRGPLPKPPPSLLYAQSDAPGVPNIPNCVGAVLKLLAQFPDPTDPAAQKLRAFYDMLPILLWRRGDRRQTAAVKTVELRCKKLLEGKWEELFRTAAKALALRKAAVGPPAANRPPSQADDSSLRALATKVQKAQAAARAGALSKARSLLTCPGVSSSATAEMRE